MIDYASIVAAAAAYEILAGRDRVTVDPPLARLERLSGDRHMKSPAEMVTEFAIRAFTVKVLARGRGQLLVIAYDAFGFPLGTGPDGIELVDYPDDVDRPDFRDLLAGVLNPAVDRAVARIEAARAAFVADRAAAAGGVR